MQNTVKYLHRTRFGFYTFISAKANFFVPT